MTTNGAWVDGVFYDGIAVTAADLNANNQWLLAQAGSGAPPSASPNQVFAGPASGSAGPAAFRALVAADIPGGGGGGGITSIALNAPPEFAVGGSPVVTPGGTLTMTKTNQPANAVWAGPVGGVGGPPSFRPLVTADLPAGGGGGITSISLSAPADFIVTGSPVSPPSGVLGLSYANQAPHAFLGGPATGSATTPTYRLLAASDVPTLPYVASVALTASPEFTVSGSPVGPGTGTLGFTAAPQAQHTVWAGPLSGTGAPGFRLLAASDIPALSYLSSLTLTMPSFLSVAGSPATGAGVLTVTLATQSANLVFAGPTTGTAAAPTFRPLTLADMPGGFGTGTVTQVGLALPSIFTVTNSPVNTTGTLTGTLNTQSAGLVFAGPATGVPAAPTFRALSASDIPALPYGSVTQVAMTVPPEFVVGGSPINGSGTLAVTKSTQAANTVWAGPLSGGSVAPTFRALVGADLPLPSATTLGGVQSIAAVAHNFLTGISITGIPSASQPAFTDILGTATAGQGGTGAINLTAHGMVIAEGASPMVTIPPGAGGQLVISQGAAVDPAFKAMSGDATISAAGAITVTATGGVALGTFATQNYATPPAIGGTTPNSGAFTAITAVSAGATEGFSAPGDNTVTLTGKVSFPPTFIGQRSEATLSSAQQAAVFTGYAHNSAGANIQYGALAIDAFIPTAGSEQGVLWLQSYHGGSLTTDFSISNNGFYGGNAAGTNVKIADNLGNLTGISLAVTGAISGGAISGSTLTSAGFINGLNLTTTGGSGITATGNGGTSGLLVITDSSTTTQASLFLTNTGPNGVGLRMVGNGATTPSKTIRARNGNLEVVSDGYAALLLSLSDAGALSLSGASNGLTTASVTTTSATGGLNAQTAATGVLPASQASLTFARTAATLAGGAYLGNIVWNGPNNAGSANSWGSIYVNARAVAPGTEEGTLVFQTFHPGSTLGTLTTDFLIDNGNLYVGGTGSVASAHQIADSSGNLIGATLSATGIGSAAAPSVSVGNNGVGLYSNGSSILGFTNTATGGQQPLNMVGNGVLAFGSIPQITGFTSPGIRIGNVNTNVGALQIAGLNAYANFCISRWDASISAPSIAFGKSRSGVVGTYGVAVASGDNLGQLNWCADDGNPNSLAQTQGLATIAASISVNVVGTVGLNSIPTAMTFKTTPLINDFTMSNGGLYVGGSTAGKLLLDSFFSYGGPCPAFQQPAAPVNNGTFNFANSTSGAFLIPAATIPNYTVNMPAAPKDQQELTVTTTQIITALSVTGNGNTVGPGMPTTLAAGGFFKVKFNNATSTWYRIG
jgi:hypothetical protein